MNSKTLTSTLTEKYPRVMDFKTLCADIRPRQTFSDGTFPAIGFDASGTLILYSSTVSDTDRVLEIFPDALVLPLGSKPSTYGEAFPLLKYGIFIGRSEALFRVSVGLQPCYYLEYSIRADDHHDFVKARSITSPSSLAEWKLIFDSLDEWEASLLRRAGRKLQYDF